MGLSSKTTYRVSCDIPECAHVFLPSLKTRTYIAAEKQALGSGWMKKEGQFICPSHAEPIRAAVRSPLHRGRK